jgi:Ca-activated chloride channel family protein
MLLLAWVPAWQPLSVRVIPAEAPRLAAATNPAPIPQTVAASAISDLSMTSPPRSRWTWREAQFPIYLTIALALLARMMIGMLLLRRLAFRSRRAGDDFYESESIAVPMAVGWLRPKILLPLDWAKWSAQQLEMVLAHERAHVRRRDSLVLLLAGINRCIFWFHPLAWWVEHELGLLAEQACDEVCLARGGEREEYARLLLATASAAAQGRVYGAALSMAAGSHLRRRIDAILDERRRVRVGLPRVAWIVVLFCSVAIIYGAGAIRLDRQSPILRLEFRLARPAPPPVMLAQQREPAVALPAPTNNVRVALTATVTDRFGRFVTGLGPSVFHVFENGAERPVAQVEYSNDQPVSVGILFDASCPEGNNASCANQKVGAISRLFSGPVNSNDEFRVWVPEPAEYFRGFVTGARDFGVLPITPPISAAKGTLTERIRASLTDLRSAKNQRRVLLVVTDGILDPALNQAEFDGLAREADIPIYGVGPAAEPAAARLLRDLADRTGGEFFAVDSGFDQANALTTFRVELRAQYVITYETTPGSSVRQVEVRLDPPVGLPPLRVRNRTGMFVRTAP